MLIQEHCLFWPIINLALRIDLKHHSNTLATTHTLLLLLAKANKKLLKLKGQNEKCKNK